jgi:hypothetical protein
MLSFPVDDSFIPPVLRTLTRSLHELFDNVIKNPATARELAANPGKVLDNYGLTHYIAANDPVVETVIMATDPDLQKYAKNADYSLFMAQLKNKGYLTRLRKSKLREHFMAVFAKDQEQFVRYLKGIFDTTPAAISDAQAKPERINRIVDLMQTGNGKSALQGLSSNPNEDQAEAGAVVAATVIAWIAVGVYTYLGVVSQLVVAINIGAWVTIHSRIAVNGPVLPRLDTDGGPSPSVVSERVRNVQRAALAATVLGRKDLAVQAIKEAIDTEIDAVISAAEQMGLISIPNKTRKLVVGEMKKMAKEAIGIGA